MNAMLNLGSTTHAHSPCRSPSISDSSAGCTWCLLNASFVNKVLLSHHSQRIKVTEPGSLVTLVSPALTEIPVAKIICGVLVRHSTTARCILTARKATSNARHKKRVDRGLYVMTKVSNNSTYSQREGDLVCVCVQADAHNPTSL